MATCVRVFISLAAVWLLVFIPAPSLAWGVEGHYATCALAQMLFTKATQDAVQDLLPAYAEGNLASLCSWPDEMRFSYAAEGINLACKWAYRNATPGSYLSDDYFLTRMPIVEMRLAQGGVRLAAILNRLFGGGEVYTQ